MKHLVAVVVCVILLGILLDRLPERRMDQMSMPFRLLRLQMKDPDTQLLMPVRGVAVRRVANTWDAPRSGGRKHQGQDIFARRGTDVLSATDGIVVRVGTNRLGGKVVTVMGAGGRIYYYAHLDGYAEAIQPGDSLLAGDTIGFVGNTGNAAGTSPHLHFSVFTASGALDPLPMLVDSGKFRQPRQVGPPAPLAVTAPSES